MLQKPCIGELKIHRALQFSLNHQHDKVNEE